MSQIVEYASDILGDHGYTVLVPAAEIQSQLLFENDRSIGFLIAYSDAEALLASWRSDSEALLEANQLGLRRSMEKAWNAYLILLAEGPGDRLTQALLDSIEEDLVGTRKIARASVGSREQVARAMLPLLPLQSPPNIQPVDMVSEIRIRTTQLPSTVMDAFFAARDATTIMQLLEE